MPENESSIPILGVDFTRDELSALVDCMNHRGWDQLCRIYRKQQENDIATGFLAGTASEHEARRLAGSAACLNDVMHTIPTEIRACLEHVVSIENGGDDSQSGENENEGA